MKVTGNYYLFALNCVKMIYIERKEKTFKYFFVVFMYLFNYISSKTNYNESLFYISHTVSLHSIYVLTTMLLNCPC